MALDDVSPFAAYTVAGMGPYSIPFPYLAGTLQVAVEIEGRAIPLTGAGLTFDPVASDVGGNLYLSPALVAEHGGRRIVVGRTTPDEQGWRAAFGPREKGLETQLDRMVQADQEMRRALRGTLRVDGDLDPLVSATDALIGIDETGRPMAVPGLAAILGLADNAARAEAAAAKLEAVALQRQSALTTVAGQADYTLAYDVGAAIYLMVWLNGQLLRAETDYQTLVIDDVPTLRLIPAPDHSGQTILYTGTKPAEGEIPSAAGITAGPGLRIVGDELRYDLQSLTRV